MQITIDTSKDSPEDIRKVITLLQTLLGSPTVQENHANIFDDNSGSSIGNSFNNIFGALEQSSQTAAPTSSPESVPSLLLLDENDKPISQNNLPVSENKDMESEDVLPDEIVPYD